MKELRSEVLSNFVLNLNHCEIMHRVTCSNLQFCLHAVCQGWLLFSLKKKFFLILTLNCLLLNQMKINACHFIFMWAKCVRFFFLQL